MKKTFCMFAVAALAVAGFCEDKKESPAERFARVRELVARHSASTVTVLVRFNAPEDEEDDGFSMPYMCPNCNSIHRRGVSEYVKEERPMDMAGYVVAPDRVMVQDLMIKSNLVASVEVEFAGRRYAAKPVRRFPGKGAVELKTEKPIDGVKPIEFRAKGSVPLAEAKFFFLVKENGQMVSGLTPSPAAKFRHYPDIGKDIVQVPGNTLVLDAKGEAASLCFNSPMIVDDAAFAAPSTWKSEPVGEFDARLEALKAKVKASLVPVYVHREEEKRSERSGRMFISSDDDDGRKTDIDVVGFALENGEVIIPLNLDASKTAEIDKIEAVMPDGSRTALEWVGAFDRYALAVVRFKDGKLPKEFTPMKVYGENAAKLFLKTLYTCSTRSMDGKITFDMIPERVIGFEFARGGVVCPDVRHVSSRGRQPFAVTEDGEFSVGVFRRRSGERWSSGEELPAESVAALLKKRAFNPEYALRKGKDRIRVAWIGVETQPITPDLAREKKASGFLMAYSTRGALVGRVYPGTPAEKAGIKTGDVLLYVRRRGESDRQDLEAGGSLGSGIDIGELLSRIGGERLGMVDADRFAPWPNVEEGVNEVFTRLGIGAEVDVGYVTGGTKKEAHLVLAQAPVHFRNSKRLKSKTLGAAFADLTFEVRGYFKLADDAPGVVVSKVQPGNHAAVAGLMPFEIVTHVDDKPVKNVKELSEAIRGKQEFTLSVRRLAATRIVRVKVQDKEEDSDSK